MAELLLKFAEFGHTITRFLEEAADRGDFASNSNINILCRLELYGPQRPSVIMETTGLTSGGVTKLIDRLEVDGLVERLDDPVPGDGRGVMVGITPAGHDVVHKMVSALADRVSEAQVFIKDLDSLAG